MKKIMISQLCRFYHGEKESPYLGDTSILWSTEKSFADAIIKNNKRVSFSEFHDHIIKAMVYDSRYTLRFDNHTFISRSFDVTYSFDATCLEAGKSYKGHISIISDGGEFKIPYDIEVVTPYVKYGDEKIDDLESFVVNQIAKYKGKTQDELCDILGVDKIKKPKNLGAMLALRMLRVKGNNAEEFAKANIVVKTIRIGKNGKIKEHMSFPTFKFTDLVNQEWEDSDFYNLLSSTKFLFIVYQENENEEFELNHAQFWNMPFDDLEKEVKEVWENTKKVLLNLPSEIHDGNHYISIFPTQAQNRISHVRPHAKNSKDTYTLPDGREYPKQCFWLNNSYILSVIKDKQ